MTTTYNLQCSLFVKKKSREASNSRNSQKFSPTKIIRYTVSWVYTHTCTCVHCNSTFLAVLYISLSLLLCLPPFPFHPPPQPSPLSLATATLSPLLPAPSPSPVGGGAPTAGHAHSSLPPGQHGGGPVGGEDLLIGIHFLLRSQFIKYTYVLITCTCNIAQELSLRFNVCQTQCINKLVICTKLALLPNLFSDPYFSVSILWDLSKEATHE